MIHVIISIISMHFTKHVFQFVIITLLITLFAQNIAHAAGVTSLNGKILLQVQSRGEAWYVNPVDGKRYSLGSPEMATRVFSRIGLGISHESLSKIPVGFTASGVLFGVQSSGEVDQDGDGIPNEYEAALGTRFEFADTDNDGYSDLDELKSGYDPLRINARLPSPDTNLISRLKGRIVLQVQSLGQAWYINPVDGKRYYLGTPQRALAGMRYFGLGITNVDLSRIQVNASPSESEQPVVDCGLGNLTNESPVSACFTPRFQACSPTKIRTDIDLGALGGIVGYEYEILGPQNNGCRVRSRFTSNPNPEYLNKDLFCVYNNHKPFSEAVQEVFPSLDACNGDLKPSIVSR